VRGTKTGCAHVFERQALCERASEGAHCGGSSPAAERLSTLARRLQITNMTAYKQFLAKANEAAEKAKCVPPRDLATEPSLARYGTVQWARLTHVGVGAGAQGGGDS
jgi:hypothetical protein